MGAEGGCGVTSTKVGRTCLRCGKVTLWYPSELKKSAREFCGRACRSIFRRENPVMHETACKNCGQLFQWSGRRPSAANAPKTCSPKCGRESLRIEGAVVSVACAVCGKSASRPRSHLWHVKSSRFCSTFCANHRWFLHGVQVGTADLAAIIGCHRHSIGKALRGIVGQLPPGFVVETHARCETNRPGHKAVR